MYYFYSLYLYEIPTIHLMRSRYTTRSRKNRHRFEEIYGLLIHEQNMDKADDYADESCDSVLFFPSKTMLIISLEKRYAIPQYGFGLVTPWAKPYVNGNMIRPHNAMFDYLNTFTKTISPMYSKN